VEGHEEPRADGRFGPGLRVCRLEAEEDVDHLQSLLERDPTYTERILGFPPGPAEAQSTLLARPPDSAPEDKVPVGVVATGRGEQNLVGFVDLILRFPTPEDCYIGLMLIDPAYRRRGHARRLLQAAYEIAGEEQDHVRTAEAGFIESLGPDASSFLTAVGYQPTGAAREYRSGAVLSTLHLYRKTLSAR
jgi:GNAT superfamily N-acetyltransferase